VSRCLRPSRVVFPLLAFAALLCWLSATSSTVAQTAALADTGQAPADTNAAAIDTVAIPPDTSAAAPDTSTAPPSAPAPSDTSTAPRTFEELRRRWLYEGVAPPDTGAWITPEAAQDSLDSFWRGLDQSWLAPMPGELRSSGLAVSQLDSLTRVGNRAVLKLRRGGFVKFTYLPLARLTFNRVEGFRPGAAVKMRVMGLHRPELVVGAGYGFSSKKPVYDATCELPLLVAHPLDSDGLPSGPSWTWLGLELEGGRTTRRFGGDDRGIRGLTALIYGADPNQYYTRKGGSATLQVRPRRWLELRLRALRVDHAPLDRVTTWTLAEERRDDVPPNLRIEGLESRGLAAGMSARWRRWRMEGTLSWHRIDGGGFLTRQPGSPDELDLRRLDLGLHGTVIDGWGDEFVLRGHWLANDRQAPLEWKGWLGDYGTLRGFPAGALVGDQAGWASLDMRWDFDLWRSLRVPVLGKLGLQPLSFVEYGRAIALDGPLPAAGEDGWRADAGLGFGKLLGFPGHRGNLRLYAARPVLHGSKYDDWRFILAFEN